MALMPFRFRIEGNTVREYRQVGGKFVETEEKYRIVYVGDAAFISIPHVDDDSLVIQGEFLRHKTADILTMRHATPRDDGTPVVDDRYIPQPDWLRVQ